MHVSQKPSVKPGESKSCESQTVELEHYFSRPS